MSNVNNDYKDLVKKAILDQEDLARATLSGSLPGQTVPWCPTSASACTCSRISITQSCVMR